MTCGVDRQGQRLSEAAALETNPPKGVHDGHLPSLWRTDVDLAGGIGGNAGNSGQFRAKGAEGNSGGRGGLAVKPGAPGPGQRPRERPGGMEIEGSAGGVFS